MTDTATTDTPPRGPAVYFDGTSSARNDVVVEAGANGLRILACRTQGQRSRARRMALRRIAPACRRPKACSASAGAAKRCWRGSKSATPALIAAIEDRAEALDRGGAAERRLRRKVVALEFRRRGVAGRHRGVRPAGAGEPHHSASCRSRSSTSSATRSTATSAARSTRQHLGAAFACGSAPSETAGRAALDKLVGKLEAVAALPFPLHVEVVRRAEPNAMALPGGHVYVDDGLIAKAQTPDELAGVLAHEIGHVAHRDGTRTVLQTAGLSFLFGMMLGDFVGGGAVVIAAQDRAEIVLFAPGRGGGRRLQRRSDGQSGRRPACARRHPHAHRRRQGAGHEAFARPSRRPRTASPRSTPSRSPDATAPLLDAADWSALKQICAPLPPNATGNVTVH